MIGLRDGAALLARLEAKIASDLELIADLEAELRHRRRKLELRQQSRAMMVATQMEQRS